MPPLVINQVPLGNELLVAVSKRALVGPFTCMCSHVDRIVTLLRELLPAMLAREWLLARVRALVDLQP